MSAKSNIVIEQGATFSTQITLTDANGAVMNLASHTANSEIRRWYTSSNSVPFDVAINAAAGTITLSMTPDVTVNIAAGRYVYDVRMVTPANNVLRVVEGIATVSPSVTR
jgi:hypothetical protein